MQDFGSSGADCRTYRLICQNSHFSHLVAGQRQKRPAENRFRDLPVPNERREGLELVHRARKLQKSKSKGEITLLWTFKRARASRHILTVMAKAKISGKHATAKG